MLSEYQHGAKARTRIFAPCRKMSRSFTDTGHALQVPYKNTDNIIRFRALDFVNRTST